MTPRDLMFALYGKEGEPSSGARQMPAHFGSRALRIISGSSPVATQIRKHRALVLRFVTKALTKWYSLALAKARLPKAISTKA
jgi:hypothetical protein